MSDTVLQDLYTLSHLVFITISRERSSNYFLHFTVMKKNIYIHTCRKNSYIIPPFKVDQYPDACFSSKFAICFFSYTNDTHLFFHIWLF